MKKFFTKFLLVNFFLMIFFITFWFSEISNAWSPFKLWWTEVLDNTNDRVIEKKITWTNIQSSSFLTQLIPNLFQLAFYLWSSLAVLSLIYWWFLMITSLWEDWPHKKWWNIFWFSIVWLILMLFSRAIVWIISNIKIANNSVNWIDYWLEWSSNIWNLPSWAIETEIIPNIIQMALQLVSVVVIWIIIYAWIMYIAQPEEKKSTMANLFINAVIWLIIILTSYVLVAWILKINFW